MDTGRLRAWSLAVETFGDAPIELSEAPGLTIPDNRANGISRKLVAAESGALAEIEVSIDITHTYIGDLRVGLRSPAGSMVWLHDRGGGAADNLRATWSSLSVQSLAALVGQDIGGAWTLQVSDHAGADVGKLNRWGVRLVRQRGLASAAVPAGGRRVATASKPSKPAKASGAAGKKSKESDRGNRSKPAPKAAKRA